MPQDNITLYITRLLEREGLFSAHAADRGGATKYGITILTLSAFLGRPATVDDVQALDEATALLIYRRNYFDAHRLSLLPDAIEEQVFDFGVHSGPFVAIKALQECLGVTPDGVIGPVTVAAASAVDPRDLNRALALWRTMMICRIVRRDPSQLTFLAGWVKRALSFIR